MSPINAHCTVMIGKVYHLAFCLDKLTAATAKQNLKAVLSSTRR